MEVFEVTQPGIGLVNPSNSNHALILVEVIKGQLVEATLALHHFNISGGQLQQYRAAGQQDGRKFTFLMKARHMHARSFLYALDTFQSMLKVLVTEQGSPQNLLQVQTDFAAAFPALRDVRNSAHHLEDRVRGLATGGRPISPQPVPGIAPDGNVLILDNIQGNKYGTTLADGRYGEVEVTRESMLKLKTILQDLLNALTWQSNYSLVYP